MTLLGGMGETMAVEGSTDREVFETYVERVLAPTLESGQVVIMDNLPAHKPARVRELIEERRCELVYLPSYSPDFNPTLRKRSARSRVWCAKRELAQGRHWLRYWAKHFRRSASRTLEAISSMLAIVHKPNYCETCCRWITLKSCSSAVIFKITYTLKKKGSIETGTGLTPSRSSSLRVRKLAFR